MVFPKNILTLSHKDGAKIHFNPLDALKRVASTVRAIEVSCSEAWLEARLVIYWFLYKLTNTLPHCNNNPLNYCLFCVIVWCYNY